jgi:hypothetical protein
LQSFVKSFGKKHGEYSVICCQFSRDPEGSAKFWFTVHGFGSSEP